MMNKKEILEEIKMKIGRNKKICFPAGIALKEDDNVIRIKINHDAVIGNMQTDASAFEGWVLCIKAVLGRFRFILDWAEPTDSHNVHYQRFLYRVKKFDGIFGGQGGWFSAENERKLAKSKVKLGKQYNLNEPSSEGAGRLNSRSAHEENSIENLIIREPERIPGLTKICRGKLDRQLPVGLFDGPIHKRNAIFSHGKSAIDIWSVDANTLCIFELKTAKNLKVGVLSEMFFYAMVERDEQNGIFKRNGIAGEKIRATNRIRAYLLAPQCHPLITNEVFNLVNAAFKEKNIPVTFDHKRFDVDALLQCSS